MKNFFLTLVICLGFQLAISQNDSAKKKKIVDETMTNSTAYKNLRNLCKNVGPRLSGSTQFVKAVRLVTSMMKEIGADTVYLQQCMVPHWVRGEKERGQ